MKVICNDNRFCRRKSSGDSLSHRERTPDSHSQTGLIRFSSHETLNNTHAPPPPLIQSAGSSSFISRGSTDELPSSGDGAWAQHTQSKSFDGRFILNAKGFCYKLTTSNLLGPYVNGDDQNAPLPFFL